MAEGVGFEPTRERNPLPVFKTGALNHSAILPKLSLFSNLPQRPQACHGARDLEKPNRTRIGSEPWAKLVSTILAADTSRSDTSDHEREA
jgi:hypothetical protein